MTIDGVDDRPEDQAHRLNVARLCKPHASLSFYELKVNNCSKRIVKKEYKYFITEPVYWIPVAQNIYFEY